MLGAAVLTGAVLVLRGQVPPPTPPAPPSTASPPVAVADPGLPVREPELAPRWRVFTAQRDAIDGVVGPQHVVYIRPDGDQLELTVQLKATGAELLRHGVRHDEAPWASLLHDGLLLVVGGQPVQLIALDPATGAVREIAPPAGYSFRPQLVDVGDEVLLLGWQDGQQRSCVLAVQARTGASRVAWCAQEGTSPSWLYEGQDEATWPATSVPQPGCLQWQRLRSGGQVQPMPQNPWLCGAWGLVDVGGWQVAQRPERDAAQPLIVASDGSRPLALGIAAAFVGCGRHVYWSAATDGVYPDVVYRWEPGADYREVVYKLGSSTRYTLGLPRCTDGVLSVAMTTRDHRVVELYALSRP